MKLHLPNRTHMKIRLDFTMAIAACLPSLAVLMHLPINKLYTKCYDFLSIKGGMWCARLKFDLLANEIDLNSQKKKNCLALAICTSNCYFFFSKREAVENYFFLFIFTKMRVLKNNNVYIVWIDA